MRFEYFNYANMACQTIILQWLQSSLLPADDCSDVENKTNDHSGSHIIVDHNPVTARLYYIILILHHRYIDILFYGLKCVVGVWSNYLNNIFYLLANKDIWKLTDDRTSSQLHHHDKSRKINLGWEQVSSEQPIMTAILVS